MFCPNCGHKNIDDARFCEFCGTKLKEEQPVAPFREEQPKEGSIVLPVILGVVAAILAAVVIGLGIWYQDLLKKADEYTIPDFAKIMEEENDEAGNMPAVPTGEDKESEEVKVTLTPTPTTTLAPTEAVVKEHRYELVIVDCTWEEARVKCAEKGGYLARLESEEEWTSLVNTIDFNGLSDKQFYVGARRDLEGSTYHWVDVNNQFMEETLNEEASVMKIHWSTAEPTCQPDEYGVTIYYHNGLRRWVLNDVPNALLDIDSSYSGRIGYICEYES